MATQPQKDQLIASIATKLKPGRIDHDRFQVFLDDPEGLDRLADEFIRTYERRFVYTKGFVEPELPPLSHGRVLKGDILRPKKIIFNTVMASAESFINQLTLKHGINMVTGETILATLVSSYEAHRDNDGNTYDVSGSDLIHGHFGLSELVYMQDYQKSLPESFRVWAKGKRLFGFRDAFRRKDDCLSVPCLQCGDTDFFYVGYPSIYSCCDTKNDLALYYKEGQVA